MWLKGRIEGERITAQLPEKGWDQPDAHTSK